MDVAHLLSSPMVVQSLDLKNDELRTCDEGKKYLGPKTPYLAATCALMYLANCIKPDIAFVANLLAIFSTKPTKWNWNGVKHILQYSRALKI